MTIRNFPDKLDLEWDLTTTQMEGTDGKKFPALDSPDLQRAKERDKRMLLSYGARYWHEVKDDQSNGSKPNILALGHHFETGASMLKSAACSRCLGLEVVLQFEDVRFVAVALAPK